MRRNGRMGFPLASSHLALKKTEIAGEMLSPDESMFTTYQRVGAALEKLGLETTQGGMTSERATPRIAALTSMTRLDATMIIRTEYLKEVCSDLSKSNNILNLKESEAPCHLGGFTFTTSSQPRSRAQAEAFKMVLGELSKQINNLSIWLMVGHTAWQPKNRIVLNKRILRSLRESGIILPEGEITTEMMIEENSQVKYFGAIRCEAPNPVDLMKILHVERACTILFGEDAHIKERITSLITGGWSRRGMMPPRELLAAACQVDLYVGFPIGEFDDQVSGFGCLASSRAVQKVLV